MTKRLNEEERFWSKVNKEIQVPCWIWTGSLNPNDYGGPYGLFRLTAPSRKMVQAHRYVFEYYNGSIHEGMQIDHTCFNRLCVNPDHLEEVTPKENTRRLFRGNKHNCPTCRCNDMPVV